MAWPLPPRRLGNDHDHPTNNLITVHIATTFDVDPAGAMSLLVPAPHRLPPPRESLPALWRKTCCRLKLGRELVEEPELGLLDRNNDDREGGHKEAAPPLDCIQVPPAAPGSD